MLGSRRGREGSDQIIGTTMDDRKVTVSTVSRQSGSCELLFSDERHLGLAYVAGGDGTNTRSYGFLSGAASVLDRARLSRDVRIRFYGTGLLQGISIVSVHASGLALVTFNQNIETVPASVPDLSNTALDLSQQ